MQGTRRQEIAWTKLDFYKTELYVAATEYGLCYVGTPDQAFEEFEMKIKKQFPEAFLIKDREALQRYTMELAEFLEGGRRSFSVPVDVKGTPFQEEVWEALMAIPYGETCSYGEIAERINKKSAVRAVGTAIGANPVLMVIPCHRVIGKNGSMTGYRGGIEMKQLLLELERENRRFLS